MAYCKDKSIEKQRGCAIKELTIEKRSVAKVLTPLSVFMLMPSLCL